VTAAFKLSQLLDHDVAIVSAKRSSRQLSVGCHLGRMQVWAPEILCVGRGYLRMRERKSEREKQRERERDRYS
jgi:hypothetical protein